MLLSLSCGCCVQVDYVSGLHSDTARLLKVKDSRTTGWPDWAWLKMMAIGDRCSSARRNDRPAMTDVRHSRRYSLVHLMLFTF